jgi:hypothetical protein
MLPLSDPRWRELSGGYGVAYDASVTLLRMEKGENVWDELWQELHHQGDLGEASYAAVPHIVRIAGANSEWDWNFYGLVSTIEVQRHRKANPALADWLVADYGAAWSKVLDLALADLRHVNGPTTLRSILGAVALAKEHLKLGAWMALADESEIDEALEQQSAWSELYR